MSIWGPAFTENDDAADWLHEFSQDPMIVSLNEAFDDVLLVDDGRYLEVTEGAIALVAAAIVAELLKVPGTSLLLLNPTANEALFEQATRLTPGARLNLVKRARRSVGVVSKQNHRSELVELVMEDAQIGQQWKDMSNDLALRLKLVEDGLTRTFAGKPSN